MFTGIVQGLAQVQRIQRKPGLDTFLIGFPANATDNLAIGASVAINGTCLTVTRVQDDAAEFDVMQETLAVTNLASLKEGDSVNFERAARIGDEIGGHLLSGHVHAQARIVAIERPENNVTLTLDVPEAWAPYLFSKGYIGLNGASLTLGQVEGNRFQVHLIPETLRQTTFGHVREGDWINLEVDSHTQAIVDTLKRMGLSTTGPAIKPE